MNGTQDIENIIVRLVKDNRLFTQFDIAYGMVAQVFMQLKPFLVEGTYWIAEPLLMNIPELKTQRGRYPSLLDGHLWKLTNSLKLLLKIGIRYVISFFGIPLLFLKPRIRKNIY